MSRAIAIIGCLVAAGCAENAILELELTLPPRGEGRDYAKLEAFSGQTEFDLTWSGGPAIDAIQLEGADQTVTYSIEADGDEISQPLYLRVRFCERPDCDFLAGGDEIRSEAHVRFPRAFFIGVVSEYRVDTIGPVPVPGCIVDCPATTPRPAMACPCIEVDPCRVGSAECIGGEAITFCSGLDGLEGSHKCDPDFVVER